MLVGLNRSVNKDNCTGEGYGGRAAGLRLKEEDLGLSVGRSVRHSGALKTVQYKDCSGKVDREDLKTS